MSASCSTEQHGDHHKLDVGKGTKVEHQTGSFSVLVDGIARVQSKANLGSHENNINVFPEISTITLHDAQQEAVG